MASAAANRGVRTWGLLAEFGSPAEVYHAAERVRDAGYRKWDVYSPMPVHGIGEAMGLKPSKMGWIVGTCAALGASGAYLLQWWTSAVAYPMIVHGKPFGAWEPFTPITFELGVLLSGFGAVLGMLAINGLPRFHHPLFTKERFLRTSDDGFFIAVDARDPKFSATETARMLEAAGASAVETVEDE